MNNPKGRPDGAGRADPIDDEREKAIKAFVLAHFECEPETGVLVPVCSENEFHQNLNVTWDLPTGEIKFDSCAENPPLIASREEWRLATKEYRSILFKVPELQRRRALARIHLARNTDDWLGSFGGDNPASLAMIGERALQRWEATADPFQLELAKRKFKQAAAQGDSQAAYRLATYQVIGEPADPKHGRHRPTYLEEESGLRDDYKRFAAKSGHPILTMDLEQQHFFDSSYPDPWESEIESQKEDLNRINGRLAVLRPLAEQGDTAAKLDAARLLGEKITLEQDSLFRLAEQGLIETESDVKQFCPEWGVSHDQQRTLLYSAATDQPEARFLLVSEGIERDDKEALRLLRSAASPPAGEQPFVEALIPLAKRLIQAGELVEAEQCLRQAISNGLEARLELADLIFDHAAALGRERSEAVALYEDIAAPYTKGSEDDFFNGQGDRPRYWSGSAKAALRAGLAYLRGSGVARDTERARRNFAVGADLDAALREWRYENSETGEWRGNTPSLYCELACLLGWGGEEPTDERRLRYAIRFLFARLTSLQYSLEPDDALNKDDLLALFELNSQTDSKHDCTAAPADGTNEAGQDWEFLYFVAAIRILSEPDLAKDEISQLLQQAAEDGDPGSLLMLAWVCVTDRFGGIDPEAAGEFFERAIAGAKRTRRETWWREREDLLGKETRHGRVVSEAEKGLRYCAELRTAREVARRGAERALEAANRQTQIEVAKREAVEDMMAMFAHKFRGPVDSILFNTAHRMEAKAFADAAKTMNGLLDVFSVVSSNPDKLIADMQQDCIGKATAETVLLHSLKLALIQLLSVRDRRRIAPYYLAFAKKDGAAPQELSLSHWSREENWQDLERTLQSQWEDRVGNMAPDAGLQEVAAWMAGHLIPIRFEGFDRSNLHFAEYGTAASLLTVVFTEILVNAIKYSDPSMPGEIIVSWDEAVDGIQMRCSNPSTKFSRQRGASKGSGRGHKFLKLIASHLGGDFVSETTSQPSSVRFSIPPSVMRQQAR